MLNCPFIQYIPLKSHLDIHLSPLHATYCGSCWTELASWFILCSFLPKKDSSRNHVFFYSDFYVKLFYKVWEISWILWREGGSKKIQLHWYGNMTFWIELSLTNKFDAPYSSCNMVLQLSCSCCNLKLFQLATLLD